MGGSGLPEELDTTDRGRWPPIDLMVFPLVSQVVPVLLESGVEVGAIFLLVVTKPYVWLSEYLYVIEVFPEP